MPQCKTDCNYQRKVCCIFACPNHTNKTQLPGMRLFALPLTEPYGSQWRKWIADQNSPSVWDRKYALLCNRHFKAECILPSQRLAMGSLPTVSALVKEQNSLQPSTSCADNISLASLLGSPTSSTLASSVSNTDHHKENFDWNSAVPKAESYSCTVGSSVNQSSGSAEGTIQQMSLEPSISSADDISLASLLKTAPPVLKCNSSASHENYLTITTLTSVVNNTDQHEEYILGI